MTTQPSGNVVQGGLQPSCSVPMTVHLAGRCSSNSSSGQPLLQRTVGGKVSTLKPRAETEPGKQLSG